MVPQNMGRDSAINLGTKQNINIFLTYGENFHIRNSTKYHKFLFLGGGRGTLGENYNIAVKYVLYQLPHLLAAT